MLYTLTSLIKENVSQYFLKKILQILDDNQNIRVRAVIGEKEVEIWERKVILRHEGCIKYTDKIMSELYLLLHVMSTLMFF